MCACTKNWEHYQHTADMGIRGFGRTRQEAFANAALAVVALIADPAAIRKRRQVRIACEQEDGELLLVEWLNGLLYEMAARGMLFGKFEVNIEANRLTAKAWGEKLDAKRHGPAVEVKGISYSDLKVAFDKGRWTAQCIVDI